MKRKQIARKYMPVNIPTAEVVVSLLVLDRLNAPGFWYGLVVMFWLFVFVAVFMDAMSAEYADPFGVRPCYLHIDPPNKPPVGPPPPPPPGYRD